MKSIVSTLLIIASIFPFVFSQDNTSYESFLEFKDKHIAKIEVLQEKESKTTEDRFHIIELYDISNRKYENLIEQGVWYESELVEILMDNYTYCNKLPRSRAEEVLKQPNLFLV